VRYWAPDGKSTKIDQIRQLIYATELKAFRGGYQIHILDAQTLTHDAANSLLKTLEEPADKKILILLAESLHGVLPTLVSRCQPVPFRLLSAQEIEELLLKEGFPKAKAEKASLRALGELERARKLCDEDPKPHPLLAAQGTAQAVRIGEEIAAQDEEGQISALDTMIAQVRDIIIGHEAPQTWLSLADRLMKARRDISAHANSKLLWTDLALAIASHSERTTLV
jgi:DNA polymerase III delta prime subunit